MELKGGDIRFVCPRCKGPLSKEPKAYECRSCPRQYPIVLGIPDFRLFPDPYIGIENDYSKGRALFQHSSELSFPQLVARYWEMTPGVPQALVGEYVRSALHKHEQSLRTLRLIDSTCGPSAREGLLDIGCGTAGFLCAAASDFACAVGVDIAFRWLVVARKRLEERRLDNVTLACACAEDLPFGDDVFDLAVAEDVLDHTRDRDAFLRESARVLKRQKGVFYLSTPNRFSLGPDPHVWVWGVGFLPGRFRDFYVRWRKGVPYGPIHPVSYGRLRGLLRRAPFRETRFLLPELPGLDQRLSPWLRLQARVYELMRRVPLLRRVLRLIGPSLHAISRAPSTSGAAEKSTSKTSAPAFRQ